MASDVGDRAGEPDVLAPGLRQRLDVCARASADRPPVWPVAKSEHAVVVEELDQKARREGPHLRWIGRPYGGRLRHDQTLHEGARIALLSKPIAQRRVLF